MVLNPSFDDSGQITFIQKVALQTERHGRRLEIRGLVREHRGHFPEPQRERTPTREDKKWPRRDGGCVDGNSAAINSSILSLSLCNLKVDQAGAKKDVLWNGRLLGPKL